MSGKKQWINFHFGLIRERAKIKAGKNSGQRQVSESSPVSSRCGFGWCYPTFPFISLIGISARWLITTVRKIRRSNSVIFSLSLFLEKRNQKSGQFKAASFCFAHKAPSLPACRALRQAGRTRANRTPLRALQAAALNCPFCLPTVSFGYEFPAFDWQAPKTGPCPRYYAMALLLLWSYLFRVLPDNNDWLIQ